MTYLESLLARGSESHYSGFRSLMAHLPADYIRNYKRNSKKKDNIPTIEPYLYANIASCSVLNIFFS